MANTDTEKEFMDERDLCERLGVGAPTLQGWRYAGTGPAYVKVGRLVRYRTVDVDAWLESQRVQPVRKAGR